MHKDIEKLLINVSSLREIELTLIPLLAEHCRTWNKIGYVSGVITTDGPEYVERNIQILNDHADRLRDIHDFPIFAPNDVFTPGVYERVSINTLTSDQLKQFWRNILAARYITDIFMTPRWEISGGARDEHDAARDLGLRIHYIERYEK